MKEKGIRCFLIVTMIFVFALVFPEITEAKWYSNDLGWRWKEMNKTYSSNEWQKIHDNWYHFGADGYMDYGWQYINGSWYYLGGANDGSMKSGWQYINGSWYYLGGANDGSMKSGWQYINGSWYYLGGADDGSMKSGWQYINDYFYYFGNTNDGAMKIGTQIIDGEEFYFHEDGHRSTIITQYVDTTGSQALFYTIETAQGALIVIDGGWSGNEEYVRKIIKEKGNFVDAWIITHPHLDHVGAFNSIFSSVQDISISNIYTIEMDYGVYKQCARPWDTFDVYDTFYTLTKEVDNIHYLHTGDKLEIGGCGIKVYNAYDDNTINISKDICNIGSLMFEVFGEQESMLFCSDVYGKAACDKIRDMYEEELDATYIQMGHHGNNTVTHEFIDLVSPEIAFLMLLAG